MQLKLRPIGNSVGLTIPASELRAFDAKSGDIIELEIKCVIRNHRSEWNNPKLWQDSEKEPLLLEGSGENTFDDEEWEW